MVSRSKYIKKAIIRAVLLIVAIGLIYYGMNMNNKTEDATEAKPPVVLSYDEMMNTQPIQNGKALFNEKCASCHGLNKTDEMILGRIVDSTYDKKVLYAFIRNGDSVIKSGDIYYNSLYKEFGIIMPSFPNLTDSSLDNIMLYIKAEKIYQRMPKQ